MTFTNAVDINTPQTARTAWLTGGLHALARWYERRDADTDWAQHAIFHAANGDFSYLTDVTNRWNGTAPSTTEDSGATKRINAYAFAARFVAAKP